MSFWFAVQATDCTAHAATLEIVSHEGWLHANCNQGHACPTSALGSSRFLLDPERLDYGVANWSSGGTTAVDASAMAFWFVDHS